MAKYKVPGYGEINVDEKTHQQLEATKDEDSDVEFNPSSTKVRISILMEGDLLDELKTEAKKQKMPYQTFMKGLLRKQLWQNTSGFEPRSESFECVYEGFKPCLKLVR